MRKILILLVLGLFLCSINLSTGAEGDWNAVRTITQGYRDVSTLVEASITLIKTYNPSPGDSERVSTGLGSQDFDELAIRLQSSSGTYAYILEVWTKRGATWRKAMEYSHNGENTGRIVIDPYAFDSVSYSDGSLHRIVYNHNSTRREMTVYSTHSPTVANIERSIGIAFEQGGYVNLYFTAHLDQDLGGAATNDAYLFGAKIGTESPYYCTAKQGVRDQGDPYDFSWYGGVLAINPGYFTDTGWNSDSAIQGAPYPPSADVDSSNLPTAAEVNGFTVSFQSTADPDFI